MISQPCIVQPPRLAAWLIALFSPAEGAESIIGDLLEEFSQLASNSGIAFARRWYWRHSLKTIAHLVGAGFRTAPWTIAAVVVGGFLLRWFISWISNPVIQGAIRSVLDQYRVSETDPHAYLFWFTNSILIERLIVNTLIGCVVGLVAKGREMTAAMMLGFVSDVLAVQATLMTLARTGDHGILGTLPWSFAFSIGVVVGGAIVRTRRLATATRISAS